MESKHMLTNDFCCKVVVQFKAWKLVDQISDKL